MKNRIDLEDAVMNLYTTADDIQLVADLMYDDIVSYSEDELMTVLSGISALHKARTAKLEDVYAQVFELNEYAKDRCSSCWYVGGQHHIDCAKVKVNSGMDGIV